METVKALTKYRCKICKSSFDSPSAMGNHYRWAHPKASRPAESISAPNPARNDSKLPFRCDICGAGFEKGQALGPHKRIAHGITRKKGAPARIVPLQHAVREARDVGSHQNIICDVCRQGPFKTHAALGAHKSKVHGIVPPYSVMYYKQTCGICGKRVKNEDGLRKHTYKTHPGQEPVFGKLLGGGRQPVRNYRGAQQPEVLREASNENITVIEVSGCPHCPECGHDLRQHHQTYQSQKLQPLDVGLQHILSLPGGEALLMQKIEQLKKS